MAVVLAGPCAVQGVPQHQGVLGLGVCLVGSLQPPAGQQQQVPQLGLGEVQGLVVLEQDQAVAGLAGLEQVGGGHRVLGLHPAPVLAWGWSVLEKVGGGRGLPGVCFAEWLSGPEVVLQLLECLRWCALTPSPWVEAERTWANEASKHFSRMLECSAFRTAAVLEMYCGCHMLTI